MITFCENLINFAMSKFGEDKVFEIIRDAVEGGFLKSKKFTSKSGVNKIRLTAEDESKIIIHFDKNNDPEKMLVQGNGKFEYALIKLKGEDEGLH